MRAYIVAIALILGCFAVARGQGVGDIATPVNLTISYFCNTTECLAQTQNATDIIIAENVTVIALGNCTVFAKPQLNCESADNSSSVSQFQSMFTSSCSNQTHNDTITIWLYDSEDCSGAVADTENIQCGNCSDFQNQTIYINCSEVTAASNGTNFTVGELSDCPAATGSATTAPVQSTLSSATSAPPVTVVQTTPVGIETVAPTTNPTTTTTGRQQNSGVERLALSGILIAALAIWIAV